MKSYKSKCWLFGCLLMFVGGCFAGSVSPWQIGLLIVFLVWIGTLMTEIGRQKIETKRKEKK